MAIATRCAVLGITHFSKATEGRSPIDRVTGSQAFGAVARVVFVAGKDETDAKEGTAPRHVFLRAKSNIGPDQGGFEYTIEQVAVPEADCLGLSASVVKFGDPVNGNAREVLSDMESEPVDDGGALHEAEAFLIDALAGGALPAKEVQRLALEAGVAKRTLLRAKKALRVRARKSSMAGGWEWHLPEGE
jgi:putative DNA primase/helicase